MKEGLKIFSDNIKCLGLCALLLSGVFVTKADQYTATYSTFGNWSTIVWDQVGTPGPSDTATITMNSGFVALTLGQEVELSQLNIIDNGSFGIQLDNTLTVSGSVNFGTSNVAFNGANILNVGGDLIGSNFNPSAGTVVFNGDSDQNVPDIAYNNIVFSGEGVKMIAADITPSGTATLVGTPNVTYSASSGTQNIIDGEYGTLTFLNAGIKYISGTNTSAESFSVDAGPVSSPYEVVYNNTETQNIMNAAYGKLSMSGGGTKIVTGATTAAELLNTGGSNVIYNSDSPQSVIPGTYSGNLEFTGTGSKSMSGVTTVTDTFFAGASSVYITVGSTLLFVDDNGIFDAGSSTFIYEKTGNMTSLGVYNDIILNAEGTINLQDSLIVEGDLTISSTTTLNTATYSMRLNGGFINNGEFLNTNSKVIFDGPVTSISGSADTTEFYDLDILWGNCTLNTVVAIDPDGGDLKLGAATTLNAGSENLILRSNTEISAAHIIGTSTSVINGTIICERFINSNQGSNKYWWYFSTPVEGTTVSDIQDHFLVTGQFAGADQINGVDYNPSIYAYNEPTEGTFGNGWMSFPGMSGTTSSEMERGKGYAVYIRESLTETESEILTFDGTYSFLDEDFVLSYTDYGQPDADGWNLIANPFMGVLDWTTVNEADEASDNIQTDFYTWDGETRSWKGYSNTSGSFGGGNRYIAPFQAFFVQTKADGEILTLGQENVIENQTKEFYRLALAENELEISIEAVIESNDSLSNSGDGLVHETSIIFNEEASAFYDAYDFAYLSRNLLRDVFDDDALVEIVSLTSDGRKSMKNMYPVSGEHRIPLAITPNGNLKYTIRIYESNFVDDLGIQLYDKLTDEYIDMVDGAIEYTVDIDEESDETISNRFEVVKQSRVVGVNETVEPAFHLAPNPVEDFLTVYLEGFDSPVAISVYNSVGTKVLSQNLDAGYTDMINVEGVEVLPAGFYVIEVESADFSSELKFVKK